MIIQCLYMVRVKAGLTLADINRLKYNLMMKKIGGGGGAAAKKKQPSSNLFERDYFHMNYKMSIFINKFAENIPFSLVSYDFSDFAVLTDTPVPAELLDQTHVKGNSEDKYLVHLSGISRENELIMHKTLKNKGVTIRFNPQEPFSRCFRNYPDIFKRLLSTVNKKCVVLIGPDYLNNELKVLNYQHFIDVNGSEDIIAKCDEFIVQKQQEKIVFLVAGSDIKLGNRIVDALYEKYGSSHTFVNTGDFWDNFVAVEHQKSDYMRKNRTQWLGYYPELLIPSKIKKTKVAAAVPVVACTDGVKTPENCVILPFEQTAGAGTTLVEPIVFTD